MPRPTTVVSAASRREFPPNMGLPGALKPGWKALLPSIGSEGSSKASAGGRVGIGGRFLVAGGGCGGRTSEVKRTARGEIGSRE
jgi:hypothetical protein